MKDDKVNDKVNKKRDLDEWEIASAFRHIPQSFIDITSHKLKFIMKNDELKKLQSMLILSDKEIYSYILRYKVEIDENALNTFKANSVFGKCEKLLRRIGNNKKINSFIDYGGGDGHFALKLKAFFKVSTSNSILVDMKEWAGLKRKPVYGVTFIDTADFLGRAPEVDLITCMFSLHHIKDMDFKALTSKLSRGGYLLLQEHDCESVSQKTLVEFEHMMYAVDKTHLSHKNKPYYSNYQPRSYWSRQLGLKSVGFVLLPSHNYSYFELFYKK